MQSVGFGGILNNVFFFMFVLIVTFIFLTNADGLATIFKQSGSTLSQVTYTLQGRGTKAPTGY